MLIAHPSSTCEICCEPFSSEESEKACCFLQCGASARFVSVFSKCSRHPGHVFCSGCLNKLPTIQAHAARLICGCTCNVDLVLCPECRIGFKKAVNKLYIDTSKLRDTGTMQNIHTRNIWWLREFEGQLMQNATGTIEASQILTELENLKRNISQLASFFKDQPMYEVRGP